MSKVLTDQIEKRTGGTAIDLPATGKWPAASIADDAITADKILADSITTVKILNDNVTTAKILDNNVTLAKLSDGTQGGTIYYGASGAPTELAPGTSGQYLQTAGAAANPTWATIAPAVDGLTHMSQWRLTSSFTSSLVPIVNNWAAVIASVPRTTTTSPTSSTALGAPMDIDGSGFWTFPATGWWVVEFVTAFLPTAYSSSPSGGYINYADDGSTFVKVTKENGTQEANYHFNSINSILLKIEVTTTDKVTFGFYSPGAITCNASGTENYTYATFTRVGAI